MHTFNFEYSVDEYLTRIAGQPWRYHQSYSPPSFRQEQSAHFEGYRLERRNRRRRGVIPRADLGPTLVRELERLQGARLWIDNPVVGDTVCRIQLPLRNAIPRSAGGRGYFANPIGNSSNRTLSAGIGQPFAAPPRQIGSNHIVLGKFDIHLDEDPPAPWSPTPVVVVKGPTHEPPQRSLRIGVTRQGRWSGDHLACEDFGAYVLSETQKIVESSEVRSAL